MSKPVGMDTDHDPGRTVLSQSSAKLAPLTTLGIGGLADLVRLRRTEDFPDVVLEAKRRGQRPIALGGGSNVLAADQGTDRLVVLIQTQGRTVGQGSESDVCLVTVDAGHSLPDLVAWAAAERLIGIETLAGIPGTVGAMPIQNVGAYGQETADTLTQVTAWDWKQDGMVTLTPGECRFGHRTSRFKRSDRWTILSVTFTLRKDLLSAPVVYGELAKELDVPLGLRIPTAEVIKAVLTIRSRKGMVLDPCDPDTRSVGSVFLSPVITPDQADHFHEIGASVHTYPDGKTRVGASWLMRQAGYRFGQPMTDGVRFSGKHYTLVAEQGATAEGFAASAARVRQHVAEATGVTLTFEPDMIGNIHSGEQLTATAGISASRHPAQGSGDPPSV